MATKTVAVGRAVVLDLGCGNGQIRPALLALDPTGCEVIGVDIDRERIDNARKQFPQRCFEWAQAESLPFANGTFDRVISNVSLPLMNIPRVLREVSRVLQPGGTVRFTLHPLRFTLKELKSHRRIKPVLYRLFVIANGCWFFLFGNLMHVGGRHESFQSQRGMRIALGRAGFAEATFSRPHRYQLMVDARKTNKLHRWVA